MPKLMLINPHPPLRRGEESISVIVQMPLNLAYLSSLTPPTWEKDMIDEVVDSALDDQGNLTFDADVVALTGLTCQSPRAYDIARAAKKRGMKVIMGGIHANALPAEAGRYVDAVCLGEAETVWSQILADLEAGTLKPRYDGGLPNLAMLAGVWPDREWCREKYGYKFSSIVTTKGCPFRCEFCSVPGFQGRAFRERPVEDVWAEMEATQYRGLMLAEDNFYGYSKRANGRARRLFQGMVERGIWKDWFGFSTLATANDEVMLDAMAKSGCFGFLVGLESNSEEVLKRMVKDVNLRLGVDNMARNVTRIHDYGMIVWGSVIYGADGDDWSSFPRMVEYIQEHSIDILTFGISTPLPETPLYHRLRKEGRIFRTDFPSDWFYYGTDHVTYKLQKMRLEDFVRGMEYTYEQLYSLEARRARFKRTLAATGNRRTSMFAYRVTQDWHAVFAQVIDHLHELYDSGAYPAERNYVQGAELVATSWSAGAGGRSHEKAHRADSSLSGEPLHARADAQVGELRDREEG
jgi:radical SAM superfamily enzyme YgiQ (UPF0313 family)